MRFSTDTHELYVILTIDEEKITSSISPQLKGEFVILNTEGQKNIILDLEKVSYIDSSGLSAILVANRLCVNNGGLLVLCNLGPHVTKLVEISQLDSTLNIVSGRQEAIETVFLSTVEEDDEEDEDLESEIMDEFDSLGTGEGDDDK